MIYNFTKNNVGSRDKIFMFKVLKFPLGTRKKFLNFVGN
jgi:hypothetical protein